MLAEILKKTADFPTDSESIRENEKKLMLFRSMSSTLAETTVLYMKTLGVHWNISGPLFMSLHKLTEKQYKDMAKGIDEIAERIRTIGFTAPGNIQQMLSLANIRDETSTSKARDMIEQLADDNKQVTEALRQSIKEAEKINDMVTVDLLVRRLSAHEKQIWMLKSLLVNE